MAQKKKKEEPAAEEAEAAPAAEEGKGEDVKIEKPSKVGMEANLDNVKKPVKHLPWPPVPQGPLPLNDMNGDSITTVKDKAPKKAEAKKE